jgi:hypothetical protein
VVDKSFGKDGWATPSEANKFRLRLCAVVPNRVSTHLLIKRLTFHFKYTSLFETYFWTLRGQICRFFQNDSSPRRVYPGLATTIDVSMT